MTDMTNETALQVLKWLHDEPERTNITRAALTLAIAALQHPVVTREEIARLVDPEAFLFAKEEPRVRAFLDRWVKLSTVTAVQILIAYDRADTILALLEGRG